MEEHKTEGPELVARVRRDGEVCRPEVEIRIGDRFARMTPEYARKLAADLRRIADLADEPAGCAIEVVRDGVVVERQIVGPSPYSEGRLGALKEW